MLAAFLSSLFHDGQVVVGELTAEAPADLPEARRMLAEFEADYRCSWPGDPPRLDLDVAEWAAILLYRACQLAVLRKHGTDVIAEQLHVKCPQPPTPAAHYSVDLVFRYLPDLYRMVTAAASADPLAAELREWSARWPLSSVGIAGIEIAQEEEKIVLSCNALRLTYVDRIVSRRDLARLKTTGTRQAVSAAVGLHTELAPAIAAALEEPISNEPT